MSYFPEAESRVALVTGANHGIGAAIATQLATDGFAVGCNFLRLDNADHPNAGGLPPTYREARSRDGQAVVDTIRQSGRTAWAIEADLADPGAPERVFDQTEEHLGAVSVLVHAASSWRADTFTPGSRPPAGWASVPVTERSLDDQFAVDAHAGALLIAEFARRFTDRGATWGRILTLTSGGRNGFPGEVSYGAAKAALESFTLSAAYELGPEGVTANIVHPAATDTGWISDELAEVIRSASTLRRVGQPSDVAEIVSFLVSDQARCVTANRIILQ